MQAAKNLNLTPENLQSPDSALELSILCLQIESAYGKIDETFEQKVLPLITSHQGKPVDVVVLPECALTGYDFADKTQVLPLAEACGQGKQYEYAKQIALALNAYVAMGYIEKENDPEKPGSIVI
jgi:protein N-terminal amidase